MSLESLSLRKTSINLVFLGTLAGSPSGLLKFHLPHPDAFLLVSVLALPGPGLTDVCTMYLTSPQFLLELCGPFLPFSGQALSSSSGG